MGQTAAKASSMVTDELKERELKETVERLCKGACDGWLARFFSSVSSTMDAARLLAAEIGEKRPGVVVAARQTTGRGRGGKKWEESAGALYCTTAFWTPQLPPRCGAFSLAAGCVLADLLNALGCRVQLKWPNDVVTEDRRKMAGILIETCRRGDGWAVLTGIGVNIGSVPDTLRAATASVSQALFMKKGNIAAADPPCPLDIAAPLAAGLFSAWREFRLEGFSRFRRLWIDRAAYLGEEIEVLAPSGRIAGICEGISEEGELILATRGGRVHVSAAE